MYRSRQIKVRQRDLTDCGPACIASLAAYYGLRIPISKIRMKAGTDKRGTSAYGLIKALETFGINAKGIRCESGNPKGIPLPAIAHMELPGGILHYVVIYQVKKNHLKLMDPSTGRIIRQKISEFKKFWSGILIITAPGNDFSEGNVSPSKISRLYYLVLPHKSVFIQVIIGSIFYSLLGFSTSIYIQKLTDLIVVFQLQKALHVAGAVLAIIIVIQMILSIIKSKMILHTGQLIDARLIMGYYKHLLSLPQQFFDSMRVGEIITRINDAGKIRQFLSETSINILLNTTILFFSSILLFIINWKLALMVSFILPSFLIIYLITNYLNKKRERELMEKSAEFESQLVESLQNIRTVKQLNIGKYMANETEWRFTDLLGSVFKTGCNYIFSKTSSEFVTRLFTLLVLWFGALLVFRNEITIGQLMSFYAILAYLSGPAAGLIGMNKSLQTAFIAADRLFEIMDVEVKVQSGTLELARERGLSIEFRDVYFSYGTRGSVFKGINLSIPAKKITAIIGQSGSGKSTISNLITGMYEVDGGTVYIGNHQLRDYSRESLGRELAVVPQQIDLFSGTLLQNIAPGIAHINSGRILSILERLGMQSFLETLPSGIHTRIGQRGYTLSGGERQRVSIARALYSEPSILILDEATSALDKETELLILKLLEEERRKGMTILMISHRINTLPGLDKIILLENGVVAEQGTHASLCAAGGRYSELVSGKAGPAIRTNTI